MQEIGEVFEVQGNFTGNITYSMAGINSSTNSNSNNYATQTSNMNQTNSSTQKTPMQVMYNVFNQKMIPMIPVLQQTLIQKGLQPYDKSKCFKDLKNKDVFQNDIYNYILHFNNMDSTINKQIECTKIAIYIKKFRFYHEGEII